jgi:hypothetical protein
MNIRNRFQKEGNEFLSCLIIIVFESLKFGLVYLSTWGLSYLYHLLFIHKNDASNVSYIDWAHRIATGLILLFFLLSLGRKLWNLFKEDNE